MGEEIIEGRCHCGDVRYKTPAKLGFQFLCTCEDCRILSGGLRLAGVTVPAEGFEVEGETTKYEYAGGTANIDVHFCPRCGTHVLAHLVAHPGVVVLRAGTLKEHGQFAPMKSLFEDQACPWDVIVGETEAPG